MRSVSGKKSRKNPKGRGFSFRWKPWNCSLQQVPIASLNVHLSNTVIYYSSLEYLSIDNECKYQISPLKYPYTSPALQSTRIPNSHLGLLVSAECLVIFSLSNVIFLAPVQQAQISDYKTYKQFKKYPNWDLRKHHYCSKGHLTPYADFDTNEKSKFTQILTNVAPQWQKFNGVNWAAVETAVRRYAENNEEVEVFVVTGTGKGR